MGRIRFLARFTLASVLGAGAAASADTLHVPGDYETIQAAIDAAVDGDTVLVADGTYTGDGNRDMSFGGRAITVRSEHGAEGCVIDIDAGEEDWHRAFSFLQGEGRDSVVEGFTIRNGFMDRGGAVLCGTASPEFRSCVFEHNTAAADSDNDGGGAVNIAGALSGPAFIDCTFRHNLAVTRSNGGGGAIMWWYDFEAGSGGLVLERCVFEHNTAMGDSYLGGGAVLLTDTSGSITADDCVFEGNEAVRGGAMAFGIRSGGALLGCSFSNNTAGIDGGAIWYGGRFGFGFSLTVVGCRLVENVAMEGQGGGLYAPPAETPFVTLVNALVADNTAQTGGGGLATGVSLDMVNCTIVGNTSRAGAGGLVVVGTDVQAANSILWDNSAAQIDVAGGTFTATYSDIEGGWEGTGNIDGDPLLAEDGMALAGSPAIDAGDTTALPADEFDLDGDGDVREPVPLDLAGMPRRRDDPATRDTGLGDRPIVDMGAFEFQGSSCAADCDADGRLDILDFVCFQALFQAGDPGADCDGDGALDILDFVCFQVAFQAGCP
jgi:hypothetical protein